MTRTRAQQAYRNTPALLAKVASVPGPTLTIQGDALKKGVALGNALKNIKPTHLPQQSKQLRGIKFKSRRSAIGARVISALAAYRAAKGASTSLLRLHAPSKRQRRRVARTARLRRDISKGQKKRLRLGRIQPRVKVVRYPTTQFATKRGATILWKRQLSSPNRYRLCKQLGSITSALTLFTRLYKNQEHRSPSTMSTITPTLYNNGRRAAL